ncbi:MAG: response regulator [Micavibrio sp.]
MNTSDFAKPEIDKNNVLRVLIVDDNHASAQTMGWMIELLGHDVRLAHDSHSALETAKDFLPQVVLLDIGLPGKNGYEVCQQMKMLPELQKTLFIAQTGWGQDEHRKRSQEVGFQHHLVKPVSLQTLEPLLASVKP